MPRPIVTLKLATSLDGRIALANGESEWITGEKARLEGRKLRAGHDAIAVGSNTAVLDNPQLTARILGAPDPVRVVFDSRLRLSPESNLVRTAQDIPVIVMCLAGRHSQVKIDQLVEAGVNLIYLERGEGGLDVKGGLSILRANFGISRLLVEGGGQLAASFIRLGVVDVIEWFRAPIILGGDGRPCIGDLGLERLDLAQRYARVSVAELGDDLHERYERINGLR